jgi:hypothetical protein
MIHLTLSSRVLHFILNGIFYSGVQTEVYKPTFSFPSALCILLIQENPELYPYKFNSSKKVKINKYTMKLYYLIWDI